jgi:hypothetical protein
MVVSVQHVTIVEQNLLFITFLYILAVVLSTFSSFPPPIIPLHCCVEPFIRIFYLYHQFYYSKQL